MQVRFPSFMQQEGQQSQQAGSAPGGRASDGPRVPQGTRETGLRRSRPNTREKNPTHLNVAAVLLGVPSACPVVWRGKCRLSLLHFYAASDSKFACPQTSEARATKPEVGKRDSPWMLASRYPPREASLQYHKHLTFSPLTARGEHVRGHLHGFYPGCGSDDQGTAVTHLRQSKLAMTWVG